MSTVQPTTTFVHYHNSGGLCHRIYRFLNLVQFALRHNVDVCSVSFAPNLPFFEPLKGHVCLGYSPKTNTVTSPALQNFYHLAIQSVRDTLQPTSGEPSLTVYLEGSDSPVSNPSDPLAVTLFSELYLKGVFSNDFGRITVVTESQIAEENDLASSRMIDRIPPSAYVILNIDDLTFTSPEYRTASFDVGRRWFQPHAESAARQIDFLSNHGTDCDVLVGVHIRQKDFRTWAGGKWFFPVAEYYEAMKATRDLLGFPKVRFLIASDEPISTEDFPGLDVVKAPGHPIDDLYLLSQCNYLVGTNSGFVRWAAIYGNKPLFCLDQACTSPTSLADFLLID